MAEQLCTRPGCTKPATTRGMCRMHYHRRLAMGFYGYRDPGPARAHIQQLQQLGWTLKQVAQAARLAPTQPSRIMAGKNRKIWPETEQAILALPLVPKASRRGVDGTGTFRRVEALQWMGWPMALIAERAGLRPYTLSTLRGRGDPVSFRVAHAVAELYEQVSHLPGPSQEVATKARRRGCAPPAAWDDETIDAPNARPQGVRRVGVG